MVAKSSEFQSFLHDRCEVNVLPAIARTALANLSRAQYLFHRAHETISIVQHQTVKIAPLIVGERAAFKGLQVKPNGGNRRLQFMCNGVEEAILLLTAADFADKKDGV